MYVPNVWAALCSPGAMLLIEPVRMNGRLLAVAASVLALAMAAAWDVPPRAAEGPRSALATLPQSNEALVLSSRVEEAVRVGDYRLAVELIAQIDRLPERLVAAPASRTYYPVWRHAMLLAARLPEPAVQLYRQLYDGEVEAQFQDAVARGDIATLATLFRTRRLATVWPRIGDELVAQLMDRGRYGEVVEILDELDAADAEPSAARDALRAVALAHAGAGRTARAALQRYLRVAESRADPAEAARRARIEAWFARWADPATRGGRPRYLLEAPVAWVGGASAASNGDSDEDIAEAIDVTQRLPLIEPVVGGDTLVFTARGRVYAYDALTLTLKWSAKRLVPEGAAYDEEEMIPTALDVGRAPWTAQTQLLLSNHMLHTAAIGDGAVYTLERLTLVTSEDVLQQPFAVTEQTVYPNELVARDLETGAMLWHTGQDPADPLAEVEFEDRPLVLPGRLLVPIRRGKGVAIAELDPATGALRREVPVLGPPIHFTREGGRFLITADETSVYLCTGNGVVIALRRDDLSWQWATVYPSTVAEHLGRLWWKPPVQPREFAIDRPVLAGEQLIVAPTDSLDVFALDRFSGRELWRIPRREFTDLVGGVSAGVVLTGNGLTCLDAEDPRGRDPKWKTVPLEIVGRCAIFGDRVYAPTRYGVVVVDGRTGKIVADQQPPGAEPDTLRGWPMNLAVTSQAVFGVSPDRVLKIPDEDATRARCEALLAASPGDARARLSLAWLAAMRGDYDAARESLEAMDGQGAPYRASREQLLRRVYLALAERANDSAERLDWLRQALRWTHTPSEAAELAIRIGRSLEAGGAFGDAAAHYCQMLADAKVRLVEQGGVLQVAAWLRAAQRLRGLLADAVSASAAREAVATWLDEHEGDGRALLHLREALADDDPLAAQVEMRILLSTLVPEVKGRYASRTFEIDDARLARRVGLAQWETLVALDRLDEAHAARERWYDTYGASDADLSSAEQDQLAGIELAMRKLDGGKIVPFGEQIRRQWVLEETELVVDPARQAEDVGRWIVVRNEGTQEIQLINTLGYQGYPQRKTIDGLIAGAPGQRRTDPERSLLGRGEAWQPVRRTYWTMRRHGGIAAVPVAGGLVGVGLGPERGGGRRLWERAVASWEQVPDDFAATSAGGRYGVYVSAHPGRVELIGWDDGATRWRRDLPGGMSITRMVLAGEMLVVRTEDGRVWAMSAATGSPLRSLEGGGMSGRDLRVVGETIVAWGDSVVAGYKVDSGGFSRLWSHTVEGLPEVVVVEGTGQVVVRGGDARFWQVLDVESGRPLEGGELGPFDIVRTAVTDDAGRLLIAGAVDDAVDGHGVRLAIGVYEMPGGRELWYDRFDTRAWPTPSSLRAHAELVPILLIQDGSVAGATRGPSLLLVGRGDGARLVTYDLEDDYERHVAACSAMALVSPERIIVQVDGNLIGYGNSRLRPKP